MARKSLNDDMYGKKGSAPKPKPSDDWDAFEAQHLSPQGVKEFVPPQFAATKSTAIVTTSAKKEAAHFHAGGERCYHKHPALKLPGTELVIHGGSCSSPAVKDADVYVGFDHGMRMTDRAFPWTPGVEFLYEIQDMSVPKDASSFKALVFWVKQQLEAGRKVHCGCIGGHGRTGTFFAALVSEFGEKDAISYVRKHYCPKAVESGSQVSFLHQHFGVTKVDGYKTGATYSSPSAGSYPESSGGSKSGGSKSSAEATTKFTFMPKNGEIWARPE